MKTAQNGQGKIWGYRYVILATLWLLYVINYMDRIAVMTLLPVVRVDLNLTHQEMGLAASVFFAAYAVAQISAGYLSDRFGSKRIMGIAIVVFTAITFLTGLMKNFTQFFLLRLGLGFGEGHHFTPANKTISDWFPKSEKGRATAMFGTSWSVAIAIVPIIVSGIAAAFDNNWRVVFFILAVPGIIGVAALYFLVADKPEEMLARGRVSQAEYDHIKSGLITEEVAQGQKAPGFNVLCKDVCLWIYGLQTMCMLFIYWGINTWIASFLYEQHQFNLKTMGIMAALPYIAAIVSTMLGGWLMDKVFNHKTKQVAFIAFATSAPSLYYIGQIPKGDTTMLITMLLVVGFVFNLIWGVIYAYPQIRYPKEVMGKAVGLTGSIGMIGSFLSPLIAGYLVVKTPTGFSYDQVFVMFAAVAVLGAFITLFLKEDTYKLQTEKQV